jgi:hypothetical protein
MDRRRNATVTLVRINIALGLALACVAGCADSPAPPSRDPVGPAEPTEGRRIRRLSAEQFHRSLEIATGQTWARFEAFAPAMGRPDFVDMTEQGLEISVTFDKLVHDAATEACTEAVAADRAGGDVILREASLGDRDGAPLAANLRYLYRRFLGFRIEEDTDARLAPWLALLEEPAPAASDDAMAARWVAVCIGLVTHPDFLTY